MKFIRKIPHIDVDISIYDWNQKHIVKFELDGLEQTYKISHLEVANRAEVEEALTPTFIAQVLERFADMKEQWEGTLGLTL